MKREGSVLPGNLGLLGFNPAWSLTKKKNTQPSIVDPASHFHEMKFFNQICQCHLLINLKQSPLRRVSTHPNFCGPQNLLDGLVVGTFTEHQQSSSRAHQQPPHLQALDG